MGPVTLFDKSFLQSLSVDEAVWFDHFFYANICPMFYVETLSDLDKKACGDRTPDQEVGIIASKFPDQHGTPNVHHYRLCLSNLMGYPVPLNGQIIIDGGRPVRANGQTGMVFGHSPEVDAFGRWQRGEFREIERLFSREWRKALITLDLNEIASGFRSIGIDGKTCKTLDDARIIAGGVATGRDNPFERMRLAISLLNIPKEHHKSIIERWSIAGYPPLVEYAPYAAYVLTIEVFFQLALAANLISTERPSNRVDIGYLYYLPFCMLFVSSDRLHQRCSRLFLREDQEFIWGLDLKAGLKIINAYYMELPEAIRDKGIINFACTPPKDKDFTVTALWDRHLPNWRKLPNKPVPPMSAETRCQLVKKFMEFTKAPELKATEVNFDVTNPDAMAIQRSIPKGKGSWWLLPKDFEVPEDFH